MALIHGRRDASPGCGRFVLATLATLVLSACGGGGGSPGQPVATFSVGGTLTGLVGGQQVTLRNNGLDPLVVVADGSFTFSEPVSGGGGYGVTVDVQPSGGTCTVTNGAGTGLHANVTNVTVSCTPHSYAVGGTLTGLGSGQQLTLQDNATDPQVLAADGAFAFPTSMVFGSTYSVTITAQPGASSQQFCNVANGHGMLSGPVTNVNVSCNTEVVLRGFATADSAGGLYPVSGLTADSAGNFYGTTMNGGTGGAGVIYRLTPSPGGGYAETIVYDFGGGNGLAGGLYPYGNVVLDAAGNLYGTTLNGGVNSFGIVYKLSPAPGGGYAESVLYAFDGSTYDGGELVGGLVLDGAGNILGVNQVGAGHGYGCVFELSPAAGGAYSLSIVYSFTGGTDGGTPLAGLIMDGAGNLFGTTSGSYLTSWFGAVYELTPTAGGGYSEVTLHTFTAALDGAVPSAGLTMDGAGNLYGTTRLGSGMGGNGIGTVFKLAPSTGGAYVTSILYSFTGGSDGAAPLGGVTLDSAGNIYGTTSAGGNPNCNNGCGTVFKLAPSPLGYTESVLYPFPGGSLGAAPMSTLVRDAHGNLYGTTYSSQGAGVTGGADAGNVFEILVP